MVLVLPLIDSRIYAITPGFRALSITVKGTEVENPEYAKTVLQQACASVLEEDHPWIESHIEEWGEAFRKFGAKPKRTPCSVAALRKRVFKDGTMPSIDPIVDIYNAISIRYGIPVGGENMDAYQGTPVLTISDGSEKFGTMKNGEPATENPEVGEVIWCDDLGVTCRRWNWRQGVRTRIDPETLNMWFILESLPTMPIESLQEAGQEMIRHLQIVMPNSVIEQQMVCAEQ